MLWFGPVVKEAVSGIIINGESALKIFFTAANFEDFIVKECRTFEHFHHVPIDDREDDSIRPSQHSNSESESLLAKRECPTPKFLSRLIHFVETVLVVDQSASKRMRESFQSFPQMYSKLLPALSSLAFDTADKMNQSIMAELAPGMSHIKFHHNMC